MSELIVTIRCITYNHEAFIRECLEGFVMQQTNFRFEAIVHDDASTDGTAAIIAEYAAKYPDIIKPLYETENQYSKKDGSLKRIMDAHMHGKYIAMCEGDDYWTDPHKLQKQVDFLEANPDFSMCFHNAEVIHEDGMNRSATEYKFSQLRSGEYYSSELVSKWQIPTASIIHRSIITQKRPEHKDFFVGDEVLVATCCRHGRVYCINEKMSVYRKHRGGVSCSAKLSRFDDLNFRIAMNECFPEYGDIFKKAITRQGVSIIKVSIKNRDFKNAKKTFYLIGNIVGYLTLSLSVCSWTFGYQFWKNKLKL